MRLSVWWTSTLSHQLVEFGNHESCKNWDITFFNCHATIMSCDDCGWWPLLINHHHFKFRGHGPKEVEIIRFLFVTWPHVTTSTEGHVTVKFVTHSLVSCVVSLSRCPWSRGNGDITFFICHVTWCVHLINKLCDLVDNTFLSGAISLSNLVAIGFVELET